MACRTRRSEKASIVNVSSIVASAGFPSAPLADTSKGACQRLTVAMAADLIHDQVRVSCVALDLSHRPASIWHLADVRAGLSWPR